MNYQAFLRRCQTAMPCLDHRPCIKHDEAGMLCTHHHMELLTCRSAQRGARSVQLTRGCAWPQRCMA